VQPRPVGAPLTLGFVGRIVPAKGVHVLLAALAHLKADPPVDVLIWGDLRQQPEYGRALERQAAGLTGVRFMGPFTRADLAGVYSQMDALVVPSLWNENSPLVVHEAFAAGRPVIGSDVDGIAELVGHDVNGLLFPPGDAAALAEAVRRLAASPAERLARLRQGIPDIARAEDEIERLSEIYARVSSRAQRPARS
jgi:glycosyltransferase involved in cell wall biosynthesis